MLKNRFPGFKKIIGEDYFNASIEKNKRFENGIFRDFKSMNECLKEKFIDFNGNMLSVSRGLSFIFLLIYRF
jgi:hypothetical protein